MKNKTNKRISEYRLGLIPILLCLLQASCMNNYFEPKNLTLDNEAPLSIAVARNWYERHYPPVFEMQTRSASGKPVSPVRRVKPDWKKASEDRRGRYETVEMPMLIKGGLVMMDAETTAYAKSNPQAKFIRNVARMVILKDKKTGGIRSFIMVVVGSLNYLQTSRTMGKNSYFRREKDFDGAVCFYALDGTFTNGWRYSNGRIAGTLSPGDNKVAQ